MCACDWQVFMREGRGIRPHHLLPQPPLTALRHDARRRSIKKKLKRGASRLSSDAFKLSLSCLDVSERAPHFSSDWRQWWGRGGAGPQLAGSLRAGSESSEIISSVTCRFFFISEDAWGGRFMAVGSRWRTHIYQLHTNTTESRLLIFFFFFTKETAAAE